MQKLRVGGGVLCLALIAVCTATAQDAIILQANGSNTISFMRTESGNWMLSSTSDPLDSIALDRGSGPPTFGNDAGGSLLKGNLELLSLTETRGTGQFDTTMVLDVRKLDGSLDHAFSPSGAVVQAGCPRAEQPLMTTLSGCEFHPVTLQFIGSRPWRPFDPWYPQPLHDSPDPTPEPASILLVGSGLMMLGGLVRRRCRKV